MGAAATLAMLSHIAENVGKMPHPEITDAVTSVLPQRLLDAPNTALATTGVSRVRGVLPPLRIGVGKPRASSAFVYIKA